MILKDLLRGCNFINFPRSLERDITSIAHDSRKVSDGSLFVAIKGETHDGHHFITEAVEKGAVAVVGEREYKIMKNVYIQVENSRKALACITCNFYGVPSEHLTLLGVTGTNGKTTTTYVLKSILECWGKKVGLIGTINYLIGKEVHEALHTTPEPLEFHSLLRDMLSSGCTYVISEVSSHALEQYRVDGAIFRVAIFTNLTRDHLDFHETMENYFRAKERLFSALLDKDGTSVINFDDPFGKRLISELGDTSGGHDLEQRRILTYGLEEGADIAARDIHISSEGVKFKITFRGRTYDISSSLMGLPNVYNILSAAGASISLGVPWQAIQKGIRKARRIRGRFERVELGQNFLCIIDYAHTEEALEHLISTARELIENLSGSVQPRIFTVFGCGGNRDRGKRSRMGAVATRLSDFVILTSDNPRSEEPSDIIREIESGVARDNYIKEPDRREAIRKAVGMAREKDIILVAGKGHENYQEIKGTRQLFNDREILEDAIRDKLGIQVTNERCGRSAIRSKEL